MEYPYLVTIRSFRPSRVVLREEHAVWQGPDNDDDDADDSDDNDIDDDDDD